MVDLTTLRCGRLAHLADSMPSARRPDSFVTGDGRSRKLGLSVRPESAAAARIPAVLRAPLTNSCGVAIGDAHHTLRLGLDELAVGTSTTAVHLTGQTATGHEQYPELASTCLATELSPELSRPRARAVLSEACLADLRPRALRAVPSAPTTLGQVPVPLWQTRKQGHGPAPYAALADYVARWLPDMTQPTR